MRMVLEVGGGSVDVIEDSIIVPLRYPLTHSSCRLSLSRFGGPAGGVSIGDPVGGRTPSGSSAFATHEISESWGFRRFRKFAVNETESSPLISSGKASPFFHPQGTTGGTDPDIHN